jgi:hypothetical protein
MTHPYQPSEKPVAEVGDLTIEVRERVMARGPLNRDPLFTASQLAAEVARAVAAETERCAKVCLSCVDPDTAHSVADAIRSSAPRANGGEG